MGEHLLCKQGVRGSNPLGSTRIAVHYVYILQSERNGRHYIGQTNSLDRRVQQHNDGRVRATKYMRPWVLVYREESADGTQARKREWWLKAQKSRLLLEHLIRHRAP